MQPVPSSTTRWQPTIGAIADRRDRVLNAGTDGELGSLGMVTPVP